MHPELKAADKWSGYKVPVSTRYIKILRYNQITEGLMVEIVELH
jgi:hypothetical protein